MAEEKQQTEPRDTNEPSNEPPERTFTQAEVNEMMGKVRRETREKFSDYDDLKAKAEAYDESQQAAKSDLEKALERAAKAEGEAEALRKATERAQMLSRVSEETSVPASLLKGETEDDVREYASQLLAFAKKSSYPTDKGKGGSPKPMTMDEIRAMDDPKERREALKAFVAGSN